MAPRGPSLAEARDISVALQGPGGGPQGPQFRNAPDISRAQLDPWRDPIGSLGQPRDIWGTKKGPSESRPPTRATSLRKLRNISRTQYGSSGAWKVPRKSMVQSRDTFGRQGGPSGLVTLTRTSSSVSQIKFCRCQSFAQVCLSLNTREYRSK